MRCQRDSNERKLLAGPDNGTELLRSTIGTANPQLHFRTCNETAKKMNGRSVRDTRDRNDVISSH